MINAVHSMQRQISKVWVGTPLQIETDLRLSEVERRLRQDLHELDTMVVHVRRRTSHPGYRAIALRRGHSSGFQRFLRFTLRSAENGTVLAGLTETRKVARYFLATYLLVTLPLLAVYVTATALHLIQGSPDAALIAAGRSGFLLFMTAGGLGTAYAGMAATEHHEAYLADWLRQRIS